MNLRAATVAGILFGVCSMCAELSAEADRTALVSNPFDYPDYGGTPDIKIAEGVGLFEPELTDMLARLSSSTQVDRTSAVREIIENASGSEDVLKKGLWSMSRAKNSAMKSTLAAAVRRAGGETKLDDLLNQLAAIDPRDSSFKEGATGALGILSMLMALNNLSTMAAYKIMIEFSLRHAGVFRSLVGEMLTAHGLDALPALIYSRGSSNPEIHMFAVKWIRDLGDPLLSEQVKIKNPRRLAQLLEAYASINDFDAIDVTLSLTNHDSLIVRRAARLCIDKYGLNAKWPVRQLYENTFSKEPPETDVSEWAKALYDHFDFQRLRPMIDLFKKGLAAHQKGDLKQMDAAFEEVLGNEPMFPNRYQMAEGYFDYGQTLYEKGSAKEAKVKLKLAERLAEPGSDTARKIKAELTWIKAEELRLSGIIDPELYRIAVANNPGHEQAKARYESLTGKRFPVLALMGKGLIVSLFIFLAVFLTIKKIKS